MLNVFPEVLVYSLFAPFILRLALGFIFIRFGALSLSSERYRLIDACEKVSLRPAKVFASIFALFEIVVGIALVLGIYTQVGALVASVISLTLIVTKLRGTPFGSEGVLFDLLLLSVSLSLIFSGAGFIAFDLPL